VNLVIKSYNEGKVIREIAQIAHVSFREIGRIIRKYAWEKESKAASNLSNAYDMFLTGKPVIIVMNRLGLGYEEV
jgi:hypothetical protein